MRPEMSREKDWLSTNTAEDLQVLCYEHHVEMRLSPVLLKLHGESAETLLYACHEPGCLVHYHSSGGYFIVAQDAKTIERDVVPGVRCPKDGHLMYLAEAPPERRSFRLWKCPECKSSRTNAEIARA